MSVRSLHKAWTANMWAILNRIKVFIFSAGIFFIRTITVTFKQPYQVLILIKNKNLPTSSTVCLGLAWEMIKQGIDLILLFILDMCHDFLSSSSWRATRWTNLTLWGPVTEADSFKFVDEPLRNLTKILRIIDKLIYQINNNKLKLEKKREIGDKSQRGIWRKKNCKI